MTPQFYGGLFLSMGIALRYIIDRRRFNRRGIGGLQHFRNYERAVFITFLEWLGCLTANALMLLGLFLLIKW